MEKVIEMTNHEVLYSSNELAIFKTVFEDAISSLSPSMLASCNRLQVAQNILSRAAAGERDPIELGLAALANLKVRSAMKSDHA